MGKRILLLFAAFIALSSFTMNTLMAESFQFEGRGIYQHEKSDNAKSSVYGLEGSVYFDQVNTEGVLLNEAAFMQKAGYLKVFGSYGKIEETGSWEIKPVTAGADLCAVLQESLFLLAGASCMRMTGSFDLESTDIALNCGLGFFIQDGFAISALYQHDIIKTAMIMVPETKTTSNEYTGNFKYVTMFHNYMGINLEGSFTYTKVKMETVTEKSKDYQLGGDLYLTQAISVGGAVEILKSDDASDESKIYSARITAFVIPSFAISAGYELTKADNDSSDDSKMYTVMLTGRI